MSSLLGGCGERCALLSFIFVAAVATDAATVVAAGWLNVLFGGFCCRDLVVAENNNNSNNNSNKSGW